MIVYHPTQFLDISKKLVLRRDIAAGASEYFKICTNKCLTNFKLFTNKRLINHLKIFTYKSFKIFQSFYAGILQGDFFLFIGPM